MPVHFHKSPTSAEEDPIHGCLSFQLSPNLAHFVLATDTGPSSHIHVYCENMLMLKLDISHSDIQLKSGHCATRCVPRVIQEGVVWTESGRFDRLYIITSFTSYTFFTFHSSHFTLPLYWQRLFVPLAFVHSPLVSESKDHSRYNPHCKNVLGTSCRQPVYNTRL